MNDDQKRNQRANRQELIGKLSIGCVFNNTSRIDVNKETGTFEKAGEPTEAALRVLADKLMGNPTDFNTAFSYQRE